MINCFKPLYRLVGFNKIHRDISGSCVFSIQLDSNFARKCREYKLSETIYRTLIKNAREILKDNDVRLSFFEDSLLISSISVSGDCCCLGIDGRNHDFDKWRDMIEYGGHNIDSKSQAYDLVSLFNYWLDSAEVILEMNNEE